MNEKIINRTVEEVNKENHRKRHIQLHRSLDELVSDYISATGNIPSQNSILDLMRWSHEQTKER